MPFSKSQKHPLQFSRHVLIYHKNLILYHRLCILCVRECAPVAGSWYCTCVIENLHFSHKCKFWGLWLVRSVPVGGKSRKQDGADGRSLISLHTQWTTSELNKMAPVGGASFRWILGMYNKRVVENTDYLSIIACNLSIVSEIWMNSDPKLNIFLKCHII